VNRFLKLATAVGALFLTALIFAGAASAHATVSSSDPADGERLQSAPTSMTITFDEAVSLGRIGYLNVTDQQGDRVDTGSATHPGGDATKITTALKSGLPDGTYTGSYRVISADSHPVAGVIRFVVGNGALVTSPVAGSGAIKHSTSGALDLARWLSYAGFALLGGLWLLLTVWPEGRDEPRAVRVRRVGWWLAVVGALLELLLQGPYVAGRGLGDLPTWSLLDATLHSDYGLWHCVRLVLLGLLAITARRVGGGRGTRIESTDAVWLWMLGIAITFSAVGHARTTNPAWISLPLDTLHVLAMSAWLGGLAMLIASRMRRDLLPSFSAVAFASVAVIIVTGGYAAWRGIATPRAIFATEYGWLVVAKVVGLLALMALGNWSRVAINRRSYAQADDTGAITLERMRRSVLVELGIAVLVLIATSILVGQPRGREALAANDRKPVTALAPLTAGRTATVTLDPGVHGNVTITVELSDGTAPQSVTATATQSAKQIGPLPVPLKAEAKNLYAATSVNLPVAGRWRIDLVVSTSTADAVTTDATLTLH